MDLTQLAGNAFTKMMDSSKAASKEEADMAQAKDEARKAQDEAAVIAKRKLSAATTPAENTSEPSTDPKRVCSDADRPFRDKWLERPEFSCFFEAGGRIFCDVCKRNSVASAFAAKAKKTVQESRTALPVVADANDDDAGLDADADEDETTEESGQDSASSVPHNAPFKVPGYFATSDRLDSIQDKCLKGKKIAYCFDDGWDIGTFRKVYKGKSAAHQGTCQIYFASFKKLYCPKLSLDEYGPTGVWCIVDKK